MTGQNEGKQAWATMMSLVRDEKKWSKLSPNSQNAIRGVLIASLRKMREAIDAESFDMPSRAALVFFIKSDTPILQISLICGVLGISGTYYRELKQRHEEKWRSWVMEEEHNKKVGAKS